LKLLDNDPINQFENPDQDKEEDQNELYAEVHVLKRIIKMRRMEKRKRMKMVLLL